MRLFDCSCHFLFLFCFPFFFVAAAAAAAGGCLSGDAIYGIDDQVSMQKIWQFSEFVLILQPGRDRFQLFQSK